jgi:hypothetical protein
MPAIPTPYDISPPPSFAYEPGLGEWLLFALLVAAALAVVLGMARQSERKKSIEAFGFALSELMSLRRESGETLSKNQLARMSLILRRLAGAVSGMPVTQFSSSELQHFLEGALAPALKELLSRVKSLDAYKYQPEDAALPPSSILGEIIALVEKVEQESRTKI